MASLSEPKAKRARARKHLQALDRTSKTLWEPYRKGVAIESDEQTGEHV